MFKTLFGALFPMGEEKREEKREELAYKAREVWSYAHTDPSSGRVSERPVLVFHRGSDGMFWGLPLATTRVKGKTVYVPRHKNGKKVSALSQMRTLKAGRLVRRLGKAGEKEFSALNIAILRLLALAPLKERSTRVERVQEIQTQPRARVRYARPLPSPFSPYMLQTR